MTQDSLLREIEEDIRRERYAALWKRYGVYLIAVAVILVLSVAGYQAWHSHQIRSRAAQGERFAAAMAMAANDPERAQQAFHALAKDANTGYALLARLQEAAMAARRGDRAEALAIYQSLQSETKDPLYRDLAVILEVSLRLENTTTPENPDELREKLRPLTQDDNPWRYSARELTAALALQAGETERARELLSGLTEDAGAPSGLRARAHDLLTQIGG